MATRLTEEEKRRRTEQEKRDLFVQAYESPMNSDERVRALVKIATHAWLEEYHEYAARRAAKGDIR